MSAEYILAGGNKRVMLCERGIRTFETSTRNTTDINAVPVLKNLTHLPVILDPSHSTGHAELCHRHCPCRHRRRCGRTHRRSSSRPCEGGLGWQAIAQARNSLPRWSSRSGRSHRSWDAGWLSAQGEYIKAWLGVRMVIGRGRAVIPRHWLLAINT